MSAPTPQDRTLVLIHGWGFSRAVWSPLTDRLSGVSTAIPELPGHGDQPDGAVLADVPAAARAILQQLPAGLREPVWVGWSLGALVALAAARQRAGPQRLVLLCGTPRFAAAADWSCALEPTALAGFRAELDRDRAGLERRFAALCAQGADPPGPLRRGLRAALAEHPAALDGLRAGLAALAETDLRADWAGLKAPVAAWLAQEDALVPAGVADALRDLRPDARLRVVPGGHATWLEDPAGLADFLQEVMA